MRAVGAYVDVDIHAHVLPGIDDGPEDIEQSLAMLQAAVEAGDEDDRRNSAPPGCFAGAHVHELADKRAELRALWQVAFRCGDGVETGSTHPVSRTRPSGILKVAHARADIPQTR